MGIADDASRWSPPPSIFQSSPATSPPTSDEFESLRSVEEGGAGGGTKLFHDYFQVGSACNRIRFLGVLNIKLNRALLELKREVELRSSIRSDGIITQELCNKDNEEPE